jgi:hypothetical protein
MHAKFLSERGISGRSSEEEDEMSSSSSEEEEEDAAVRGTMRLYNLHGARVMGLLACSGGLPRMG